MKNRNMKIQFPESPNPDWARKKPDPNEPQANGIDIILHTHNTY